MLAIIVLARLRSIDAQGHAYGACTGARNWNRIEAYCISRSVTDMRRRELKTRAKGLGLAVGRLAENDTSLFFC